MPGEDRTELEELARMLKPTDLLNKARAVVINRMRGDGGWDFEDGEDSNGDVINPWERAREMAKEVGRELAQDDEARSAFVAEVLIEQQPQRAFECGLGLAEGANDLEAMWDEISAAYRASTPEARNATLLGGFIHGAHQRDHGFASAALDKTIDDPELLPVLTYFQACIGMDSIGIFRLRDAISRGGLTAANFCSIANGCVEKSPAEDLGLLLEEIASMPNGVAVALDILNMRFFSRSKDDDATPDESLISVGRKLLMRLDFSGGCDLRDFAAGEIIKACLKGEDGRRAAEVICKRLCPSSEDYTVSLWNLNCTVEALFETQPIVALDAFLLCGLGSFRSLTDGRHGQKSAIEELGVEVLHKWASVDPNTRFPLLGGSLRMFEEDADDKGEFSTIFMSMLDAAPDKRQFIGGLWNRVHPQGWSGSLADILTRRKDQLMGLAKVADEQVSEWIMNAIPELDEWIENARKRDRSSEESFE